MNNRWTDLLKKYRQNILGSIGLVILLAFVIIAITAPLIAPHDPHQRYRPMEPPSSTHLLGTNDIGNDIFSELIYGTRISLFIAFFVSAISMVFGTWVGLVAGYYKGIGFFLMRVVDIFLTIPRLPLIILIASFMPPSIWNLILIFLIFGWTMTARIIRSEVMTLKARYYVDATKMLGGSDLYVMLRHILPNVIPLVVVQFIMESIHVILAESGLCLLGLRDPSVRSWGMTLYYAFESPTIYTSNVWMWWMLPPGLCIMFTILGLTFVGYALEEIFNPKLGTGVGVRF